MAAERGSTNSFCFAYLRFFPPSLHFKRIVVENARLSEFLFLCISFQLDRSEPIGAAADERVRKRVMPFVTLRPLQLSHFLHSMRDDVFCTNAFAVLHQAVNELRANRS